MSTTSTVPPFSLAAFRLDLAASRDGAWFAVQPFFEKGTLRLATDGEQAVRVCYWDSKPFQSVLAEKLAEAGDDGDKRVEAITAAMAKRLVTDWRGMADDAGEALPFSSDACLALLRDDTLPQFYQFVSACSRALDLFRQKQGRRLGN